MRHARNMSGAAFVEYAPAAFLVNPVLPLLHLVLEIAARVILVEVDDCEIVASRIQESADVLELDLDERLRRVDLAFLPRPRVEVLAAAREARGVMLEIFL